jgi:predicted ArsR family transcriptional regulator
MPLQAKNQHYHRSTQILKLLIQHGQLSKPTLLQILKPKITDRRLREILQRLSQKGFIVLQYDKIFGHHGLFYRLTEHPERLKKLVY